MDFDGDFIRTKSATGHYPGEKLTNWKTPLDGIMHLANVDVHHSGLGRVEVSVVNLETNDRHIFRFDEVLGYKFTNAFSLERMGNSYIIQGSAWLREMHRAPMRTKNLDAANHFMFASHDGDFEVVSLKMPEYAVCKSNDYIPFELNTAPLPRLA